MSICIGPTLWGRGVIAISAALMAFRGKILAEAVVQRADVCRGADCGCSRRLLQRRPLGRKSTAQYPRDKEFPGGERAASIRTVGMPEPLRPDEHKFYQTLRR